MRNAPGTPTAKPPTPTFANDSARPFAFRNMSGVAAAGAVSRPSYAVIAAARRRRRRVVDQHERAAADP